MYKSNYRCFDRDNAGCERKALVACASLFSIQPIHLQTLRRFRERVVHPQEVPPMQEENVVLCPVKTLRERNKKPAMNAVRDAKCSSELPKVHVHEYEVVCPDISFGPVYPPNVRFHTTVINFMCPEISLSVPLIELPK